MARNSLIRVRRRDIDSHNRNSVVNGFRYADVGLDEWITLRIAIKDRLAQLYINEQKHASFIVQEMKGNITTRAVALWVDIGTEGYFKDLKITTR